MSNIYFVRNSWAIYIAIVRRYFAHKYNNSQIIFWYITCHKPSWLTQYTST